jgi:hypothetical protein
VAVAFEYDTKALFRSNKPIKSGCSSRSHDLSFGFLRLPEGKFTHATTSTWLLGIAVFIIYTLDRQLDNLKPEQIATPRHRFHKQYAKVLKLSVALAMLLGIYLLGHITYLTLMVGFGIAFITSIYLVVVSKLSSDSIFKLIKNQ